MTPTLMETDQEPVTQSFSLFQDKALPSAVENGEWHPNKDLLAMISEDRKVVLHRLNWDRLWVISPVQKPTAICWRPDGKVLAIGHDDGSITLHDAENGKMLRKNKSHNTAIVSLSWVEESPLVTNRPSSDPFCYNDRTPRFFPPPPKASYRSDASFGISGASDEQDDTEHELVNLDQGRLNILCSGDKDGIIYLNIFGVFLVGMIDIRTLPIDLSEEAGVSCTILDASLSKVALSKDFRNLIILARGSVATEIQDSRDGLYSLLIDTSVFQERHKELYQVALQASSIEELQDVIVSSLKAMHRLWSDSMRTFRDKFHLLSNLLVDHGSRLTVEDELMNVYCGASPSPGLRQFLENTLNEMGLKRLSKNIESAGKEIYSIIGERLQPAAEILAFRMGELKGLCELHTRVKSIGLDANLIDQAMEDIGMLAVQIERLLRVVSETLYQFQNFFIWLTKILKKLNNESPSQNDQLLVVHHELLMIFLLSTFNQDIVSSHLDATCRDFKVKVDNMAIERLEELVILGGFKDTKFLQRTLYQQFHRFENSYKKAFSKPFEAVSGKLHLKDIMFLSYIPSIPKGEEQMVPVSISYYDRLDDNSCVGEAQTNSVQDYICLQMPNENSDQSTLVVVRGFTASQQSQTSNLAKDEIELLVISFDEQFHCADVALYKENQLVILLNETYANESMAGNSLLVVLPLGDLPFLPIHTASLNQPIFELFYEKYDHIHISIGDGRARRIPQSTVSPLLVSASRGLACVFTSQRHAMIYILEEEEEQSSEDYLKKCNSVERACRHRGEHR